MEQKKFGWVLFLMGLSTLVLVGVQAYWLYNQYQGQREVLHRDTRKSLHNLNQDLLRRNSYVSNTDEENTYDFQQFNQDSSRLFIFASNASDELVNIDSSLRERRRAMARELSQAVLADLPSDTGIFEMVLLRTIQECADCDGKRSLSSRYPLDTMLQYFLTGQGIDLPFVAGLQHIESATWNATYPNNSLDIARLENSALSLPLMKGQEQIYVYFPDQHQWILGRLWLQLLGSVVLVVIIFGSFYYAWRVINRQKKISEMKSDFINNMTHEFKTPLATIAFAVANIDDSKVMGQPDLVRQFTQIIRDENARLNGQVEKVLNAAMIDQDEFQLKWKLTALYPLLNSLTEPMVLQVKEKGGQLKVNLEQLKDTEWLTDPFHLSNVVSNLLDNAVKYSGEKPPIIELNAEVNPSGLQIQVKDQGIGIPESELAFVFDKFYRAPTGNLHNVKGFGLGLSYVQRIIQLMDGQVSVSSKPNEGSTFSISLRAKRQAQ